MVKSIINKNPLRAGLTSGLIILLVAAWLLWPKGRASGSVVQERTYYYELDGGKLFAATLTRPDLIKGPRGGACARAAVFSCGDCAQEDKQVIAWLETEKIVKEKAPPEGPQLFQAWRHVLESDTPDRDDAAIRRRIRKLTEANWRPRTNQETAQIALDVEKQCKEKGGTATKCLPSMDSPAK